MKETNSPLVAHVGYDISSLSRVKFKKQLPLALRLVVNIFNSTLLSGVI
jgi:hypothetical protein